MENMMRKYKKDDFLSSTEPYDFIYNAKDQPEKERRFKLVLENAKCVGIYNFSKIFAHYLKLKIGSPSSSL